MKRLLLTAAALAAVALTAAPPAAATSCWPAKPGSIHACGLARHLAADSLLGLPASPADLAGVGSAIGPGLGSLAPTAITQFALSGLEAAVATSASFALHETATVLDETTTPRLTSPWFSSAYWKVAGLAAVLTLPFIFAAATQALIRSDLTLLLRAALGYLPLAMLAVAITAPLTMLMLSASDELAAVVSSAAGHQSVNFLAQAIAPFAVADAASASPLLLVLLGSFTVVGALILWIELLMREAAVYVIVLMLPLAFAALVWPARRMWTIRSLEVLVALILSKFAIVAVLSLGGLALGHSVHTSLAGMLAGIVLLILGAFTPWALLRLLPLSELASGAVGTLREEGTRGLRQADAWAGEAQHWVTTTAQMARAFAGATGAMRPTGRPGAGLPLGTPEPPPSNAPPDARGSAGADPAEQAPSPGGPVPGEPA